MSRGGSDSVGTLLAAIANLIGEGLRILSLADKRQWGQDEYEQVRALEVALDEAKRDFQDLSVLVNGQIQYETDRKHDSVEELKTLQKRFQTHVHHLRDWSRSGGPIDPTWMRETQTLQKDLHRAQCRAARRIFMSAQDSSSRCLGAFLVHRTQLPWSNQQIGIEEGAYQRRYLEELRTCNRIGIFQRFGEQDVVFICDYCDGHLIWEDLEKMPSIRSAQESATSPISPVSPTTNNPHWQAKGLSMSGGQPKDVVFAPIAIANHAPPPPGDWLARLQCPYCEEDARQPREVDDEEDIYRPDNEFEDVAALEEHLAWQHTSAQRMSTMPLSLPSTGDKCGIM